MPEIGTSGSMSGERKRGDTEWPKPPRSSSTLLFGVFGSMRDGLNRRLQFLLIVSLRWFGLFSGRKRILRFFRRAKATFIGAGPQESGQCRFLSLV